MKSMAKTFTEDCTAKVVRTVILVVLPLIRLGSIAGGRADVFQRRISEENN